MVPRESLLLTRTPLTTAQMAGITTSVSRRSLPSGARQDAKDLGSGVIRGVECDHLAFRTDEVDWQIWIAQGDRPYPCRYVITSSKVKGSPQYTIDVRDWKTGAEVASDSFSLTVPQGAKELKPGDVPDFDELPALFAKKGAQ